MSQEGNTLSLNDTWIELVEGIERVYQDQVQSPTAFMTLYTYVRDYCVRPESETSVSNIDRNNRRTRIVDGRNIVGEELYMKLKDYLKTYLENICENGLNLQGEEILRFYETNWQRHRFASKVINGFCNYLNRHWVVRAYDSGRKDVHSVFFMAIELWKLAVFHPLNRQVTLACLQLIKAERNNDVIDTQLIKNVIQSYVELDFIENQPVPTNKNQMIISRLNIYQDYFELFFLQDTAQFYRHEAATFLAHNSVTEYLKKVAQRLDEEVNRVQSYLHPSTLPTLITKVEEVLIRDQLKVIYGEAKVLLRDEKYQDLALLFKLVRRVPNANGELKIIVEDYIDQIGTDALERIIGTAMDDPKLYVERILDVYTKSFKLVQEVFSSEQGFTIDLNKACCKFINNNPVTIAAGNTHKSPELFARYCDMLLRKDSKSVEETNLEEKLNQIMEIFNYVEEKEVFQNLYAELLGKRLADQSSPSNDYEELIISKLEATCGVEYASKLRRILQDIRSNTNFN